jgi:hypothetical protein
MAILTSRTQASGVTLGDLIHIVITGDTSQNPAGSSYKASISQVFDSLSSYTFTNLSVSGDLNVSGNTTLNGLTANTISATTLTINGNLITGDTYVTGFTYDNANTITLSQNDGSSSGVTLNTFTGLTINGDLNVTGVTSVDVLTGNTLGTSGNCFTRLYVSAITSCSPLHIQDTGAGNVLIGENGGVNVGIGTNSPTNRLEVIGSTKAWPDPAVRVTQPNTGVGGTLSVTPNLPYSGYDGFVSDVLYPTNDFGNFIKSGEKITINAKLPPAYTATTAITVTVSIYNGDILFTPNQSIFSGAPASALTGLTYSTQSSPRFSVSSIGRVGVGTVSPSASLTINEESDYDQGFNSINVRATNPNPIYGTRTPFYVDVNNVGGASMVVGTTYSGSGYVALTGNIWPGVSINGSNGFYGGFSYTSLEGTTSWDNYGAGGGANSGFNLRSWAGFSVHTPRTASSSYLAGIHINSSNNVIFGGSVPFPNTLGEVEKVRIFGDKISKPVFDVSQALYADSSTITVELGTGPYSGKTKLTATNSYFTRIYNVGEPITLYNLLTPPDYTGYTYLTTLTVTDVFSDSVLYTEYNPIFSGYPGLPLSATTGITYTTGGLSRFHVTNKGNVGIGTNNPSEKLEVTGKTKTTTLQVTSGATIGYVLTSIDNNGNTTWTSPSSIVSGVSGTTGSGTTNYVSKWTTSSNLGDSQIFDNGTNVGINTSSPTSKLDVRGQIVAGLTGVITPNDSPFHAVRTNTGSPNYYTGWQYVFEVAGGIWGIGMNYPNNQFQFLTTDGNTAKFIFGSGSPTSPNGKFLMDLSTGYLGANITTPDATIHAKGLDSSPSNYGLKVQNSGGTDNLVVRNDGNVGIGTSSPSEKLEVVGKTKTTTLQVTSGSPQVGYVLTSTDTNGNTTWSSVSALTSYFTGASEFMSTTGISVSAITLPTGTTYFGSSYTGNTDLTLFSPTGLNGIKIIIKDEGGTAGSYRIRLTPLSGTIDGNPYVDMNTNYMSLTLLARNGNWWII